MSAAWREKPTHTGLWAWMNWKGDIGILFCNEHGVTYHKNLDTGGVKFYFIPSPAPDEIAPASPPEGTGE